MIRPNTQENLAYRPSVFLGVLVTKEILMMGRLLGDCGTSVIILST